MKKYIFTLEQSIWATVIFSFFCFVCQTNIFSTQEGMLRWAWCFLGREEKIWPSLIPASDTYCAVAPGQGWVLPLSPLRKLLPALLFPHALLWAASCLGSPRVVGRCGCGTAALPFLDYTWLSHSWHWVALPRATQPSWPTWGWSVLWGTAWGWVSGGWHRMQSEASLMSH